MTTDGGGGSIKGTKKNTHKLQNRQRRDQKAPAPTMTRNEGGQGRKLKFINHQGKLKRTTTSALNTNTKKQEREKKK